MVFANTHYGTGDERMRKAVISIEDELRVRLGELQDAGKLLEAQRLRMRTEYDLEMLAETGVCSGVENYSRHLDGRAPGEAPFTLLDFFPKDFLCVLDESHVAVPQLRGQYAGDRSRKETLVDHGFRLPSAMDNRPLRFEEFSERVGQVILLSATPGPWELEHSTNIVEQVIRPTGLVDPEVDIVPTTGQIDDLRARDRRHRGGRLPGAGHHPDQEDGRGPDRLPGRTGGAGAVPALRRRHHGPHRAPARAAARGVRRAGRHQPPPGGPRPARGGPGGHPRRRQGGLPAVGLVAHPDHGPGRPQRQRPGGHVRRPDHRLDDRGHRGDPAPPGPPDRLQRGPRDRPQDHHQVGHRHPGAGAGRRLRARAGTWPASPRSAVHAARRAAGASAPASTPGPWPPRWPTPSDPTPTSCPA